MIAVRKTGKHKDSVPSSMPDSGNHLNAKLENKLMPQPKSKVGAELVQKNKLVLNQEAMQSNLARQFQKRNTSNPGHPYILDQLHRTGHNSVQMFQPKRNSA